MVPGLGYSPDKMLQGRLFAYHDAQLYRVGTNHQHLPVNRPRCPFHNQQRDGAMAIDYVGGSQNYDNVDARGTGSHGFGNGDQTPPGNSGGNNNASFLSTHPSGANRIQELEANLPKVQHLYEQASKG